MPLSLYCNTAGNSFQLPQSYRVKVQNVRHATRFGFLGLNVPLIRMLPSVGMEDTAFVTSSIVCGQACIHNACRWPYDVVSVFSGVECVWYVI